MLNRIRSLVLVLTTAMMVGAILVIAAVMVATTYDVVMRYILLSPTDWAVPLTAAGVMAATVLPIPHLYATGRHIAMDLVYRAMPERAQRVCELATSATALLLGAVLAVTGFRSMVVAFDGGLVSSGTFNIPLWTGDAIIGLSGALLVLVALLFRPGGQGGEEPVDPSLDRPESGSGTRGGRTP